MSHLPLFFKVKIVRRFKVVKNDKKKKATNSGLCVVGGISMTTKQRNEIMKHKFIYEDMTLKDIADQYGIAHQTLRGISSREKWGDEKDRIAAECKEDITKGVQDAYIAAGIDINIQYHRVWQKLIEVAEEMITSGEGITKNGKPDIYKLNQLADVITKAQQGQQFTTGTIGKEAELRLDLAKEKLDLSKDKFEFNKKLMGDDESIEVDTTGLMKALAGAAAAVGIGGDE